MAWFLLSTLLGCQYLEEQRTLPEVVTWDGFVLAEISTETDPLALDAGRVSMVDLDQTLELEATPSSEGSGYWRFDEVPVGIEVAIRLEGGGSQTLPELATTVWRGTTPSGRASWLTGALFLQELQSTEDFLASLTELPEVDTVTPLADGTVAHLWGEPWVPEDWAGASVVVTDGDGALAPVVLLTTTEEGVLSPAGPEDPITTFLALDLAPGEVELVVTAADGRQARTTWPAAGGDLLSAIYTTLPSTGGLE